MTAESASHTSESEPSQQSVESQRRIDRALFLTLIREEWRLHARLFGGRRFLAFPPLLALLVGGAAIGLSATGISTDEIVTGLAILTFAFGLYSGTAGFVGSDMLENVFGDLSLILSSSTTLPLSRRRLLGTFLLKDALFYGGLFVLPMAIGLTPLVGFTATTPLVIAALWIGLFALFLAGMVITVTGITLRTRGVPGVGILGIAALGIAVLSVTGYGQPLWNASVAGISLETTSSLETATGLTTSLILTVSSGLVGLAALVLYDPTYSKPARANTDRFGSINRVLSSSIVRDENGLVTKTLIDLARSSGGLWKPVVSAGILLALVVFLVDVVGRITGIQPAPGIFFGGVLGLSAFTTYNWLTQFDSLEAYLTYPITVEAVFRAKRTAFVLVGTPTVAIPYVGAIIWFDATAIDAVSGAFVLGGYSLYYYGLTVYLAGFDPNEFLFDAVRFAAFTIGVAVVLVPTLVAGFVDVPPTATVGAVLSVAGIVVGVIGLVLSSRAGPRWATVARDGT